LSHKIQLLGVGLLKGLGDVYYMPNPLNYIYRRCPCGLATLGFSITRHLRSSSLTNVKGRMCSAQTTKATCSGTKMAPRPINALVLGCTDGAQEGTTPSVLGSTPQYSRLNLSIIKACVMENTEKSYTGRNIYIIFDSVAAIESLESFQINPN